MGPAHPHGPACGPGHLSGIQDNGGVVRAQSRTDCGGSVCGNARIADAQAGSAGLDPSPVRPVLCSACHVCTRPVQGSAAAASPGQDQHAGPPVGRLHGMRLACQDPLACDDPADPRLGLVCRQEAGADAVVACARNPDCGSMAGVCCADG